MRTWVINNNCCLKLTSVYVNLSRRLLCLYWFHFGGGVEGGGAGGRDGGTATDIILIILLLLHCSVSMFLMLWVISLVRGWAGKLCCTQPSEYNHGERDSSVVRALDSWLKGCGFESLQEQWENVILQGWLSALTFISVSLPPPCYCSST